jgi:hypothetical protein
MLIGHKTAAMFDLWSIAHFLSGVSLAALLPRWLATRSSSRRSEIVLLLLVSLAWESLEHYLEEGLAGAWLAGWFDGVEHWSNRLIGDQLMILAGFWFYQRSPGSAIRLKAASLAWLAVHLVMLPDSMVVNDLLFGGPP